MLPGMRSYPCDVFRQGRRWVTGGRARAQAAAYTLTSTYGSSAAKVNQCNHPKMKKLCDVTSVILLRMILAANKALINAYGNKSVLGELVGRGDTAAVRWG